MSFEIDHAAGYLLYAWGAFAKSNWRPRPADFQGRYIELSTHAAIPLRLPNLQRLYAAGLDVPPPLEVFGYDWPGRVKPYTAQIITANMLVLNPLCYVLNEMRTGKTLSALWAADFLMRQYPGSRCLILSNLSTVRDVWQTTILEHFLGRRTCVVLHAHDDKARFKRLAADVDFYIGNHDILRQGVSFERKNNKRHIRVQGLMGEVVRRVDIGLVIVDEASAFKNSLTNRSLAGRKILSGKPVRWPMTGSPTPQAPTDIHGLQRLVDPAYINRFDHVRNLLMEPEDEWRWKPKEGAYELAAQLLRPAVRFRAVDCFDAPEQTVTHRRALLSDEQKKKLRELKEQALTLLRQADGVVSRVSAANAGVLRAKSLQICSGAVYDEQGRAHRLDCSDRLNVLSEVVEQAAGDKIILLAPFTSVLHMLYSHVGESLSLIHI